MPGQDQTGPRGEGPRTGRGMGICGPGDAARGQGIGGQGRFGQGGRGQGGGRRGRRNRFYATGLTRWQQAMEEDVAKEQASEVSPNTATELAELRRLMEATHQRLDQMEHKIETIREEPSDAS